MERGLGALAAAEGRRGAEHRDRPVCELTAADEPVERILEDTGWP